MVAAAVLRLRVFPHAVRHLLPAEYGLRGKFNPPEPELFLLGAACALPGMALGSVIRWGRGLPAAPQDRRRPLWAFGLVWGGCVILQLGLLWLPMVLQFPGTLLAFFGLPYFPSEAAMAVFTALSDIAYFAGSCSLAQIAGLAAGFLVGRSSRWTGREKARLLPLFGAAGALALGVGGSQGGVVDYMGLDQGTSLLLLPLGYLAGQVLPGAGLGAGMLVARRKNPVDKPQP